MLHYCGHTEELLEAVLMPKVQVAMSRAKARVGEGAEEKEKEKASLARWRGYAIYALLATKTLCGRMCSLKQI